jgi:hypothetical protein
MFFMVQTGPYFILIFGWLKHGRRHHLSDEPPRRNRGFEIMPAYNRSNSSERLWIVVQRLSHVGTVIMPTLHDRTSEIAKSFAEQDDRIK